MGQFNLVQIQTNQAKRTQDEIQWLLLFFVNNFKRNQTDARPRVFLLAADLGPEAHRHLQEKLATKAPAADQLHIFWATRDEHVVIHFSNLIHSCCWVLLSSHDAEEKP